MSRAVLNWEEVEPLLGPPCPDFCEDFEEHIWIVDIEEQSVSLRTDDCPICQRGMRVTDMADFLSGGFKAKLRGEGYSYGDDYDYYLIVEPTGEME